MTLKDLLKKKDKVEAESSSAQHLAPPAFTFIRTTTNTQEIIDPPTFPGDRPPASPPQRSLSHRFRLRRQPSAAQLRDQNEKLDARPKSDRRLSEMLHLGPRDRAASTSSVNIPADLPEIQGDSEDVWEKRATLLAKSNPNTPDEGKKSSEAPVVDKSGDVRAGTQLGQEQANGMTGQHTESHRSS